MTVGAELPDELRGYIASRVRDPWATDDILQEVLLRIHGGLHQLRDDHRLRAWAYRIARNAVIDHYRANQRNREEPQEVLPEPAVAVSLDSGTATDPGDAAARTRRTLSTCIAPVLDALPAHYREALTLVELEQRTQAEAARAAGISLSGMKSRVQRARRHARALIEGSCALTYDRRGAPVSCRPVGEISR